MNNRAKWNKIGVGIVIVILIAFGLCTYSKWTSVSDAVAEGKATSSPLSSIAEHRKTIEALSE